jgi:hypothetical protein
MPRIVVAQNVAKDDWDFEFSYLVDGLNWPMEFKNMDEARSFLAREGLTQEEINRCYAKDPRTDALERFAGPEASEILGRRVTRGVIPNRGQVRWVKPASSMIKQILRWR